jgi:hypothetical protein
LIDEIGRRAIAEHYEEDNDIGEASEDEVFYEDDVRDGNDSDSYNE